MEIKNMNYDDLAKIIQEDFKKKFDYVISIDKELQQNKVFVPSFIIHVTDITRDTIIKFLKKEGFKNPEAFKPIFTFDLFAYPQQKLEWTYNNLTIEPYNTKGDIKWSELFLACEKQQTNKPDMGK